MMPFTEDLSIFYATIYGGIIIGIIFDLYRAIKSNFKLGKILTNIYDIIFWVISTLIIFTTINAIESFDIRYYHFIALIIGFILYYNTASKFILNILNKIIQSVVFIVVSAIKILVSISINLYYVIVYTMHFLFDIIFYIPNIMMKLLKKFEIKKNQKSNNNV